MEQLEVMEPNQYLEFNQFFNTLAINYSAFKFSI